MVARAREPLLENVVTITETHAMQPALPAREKVMVLGAPCSVTAVVVLGLPLGQARRLAIGESLVAVRVAAVVGVGAMPTAVPIAAVKFLSAESIVLGAAANFTVVVVTCAAREGGESGPRFARPGGPRRQSSFRALSTGEGSHPWVCGIGWAQDGEKKG